MSKSSIKHKVASAYTPEFRLNAIKLAQSGEKSFSQTAKDLGIPVTTLHAWISKANKGEWSVPDENITSTKIDRQTSNGKSSGLTQKLHEQLNAEQKKSADLERQVRRLTQEREILKKAMAYFAEVPK